MSSPWTPNPADAAAVLVLAFWIGLALDRRRWWPAHWVLPPRERARPETRGSARVAVIVPARNEALVLGESLPSLLPQEPCVDRIVLVDDHSTDATARVAREIATSHGAEKLRVVEGRFPPEGWTGKLNALQSGIDLVDREEGDTEDRAARARAGVPRADEERREGASWILFTDADILHPEDSIERLTAHAVRGPYDLVSVMVRLRAASFWEKLLIPAFVYFFQLMYPFQRVSDARSSVAAAAGGCVLIRRDMLVKIGGLASLHDSIIDDVTLARRVKRAGGRCWLGSDEDMVSLRGYTTLGGIVNMVARTAFTELRYRYSLVAFTWIVLGVFFVSPPFALALALWAGRPIAAGAALLTWSIQAASLAPVVRHLRARPAWSTVLPFASAVYGVITGISAWRHFRGRGITWRGRVHEASMTHSQIPKKPRKKPQ